MAQAARTNASHRPDPYDHRAIEAKWRQRWDETRLYATDISGAQRPFYNLMMFPYPSAEGLHVGNVYAFMGSDIYGRTQAMLGNDVFEPMGFDAFGIHSENYAIKQGIHPKSLTAQSVSRFRDTQLTVLGARFDWTHEVHTADPDYYRWTQWLFVQLFKHDLAYKALAPVNWCPNDKTVLADEQVIAGHCERCDAIVERRHLEQWFFRITKYAERLLTNLDHIDWPEKVKTAQRNWIGRSEGLEFAIPVAGHPEVTIPVFTTRPDTVFGMTYVVLAPEHPLVDVLVSPDRRAAIEAYQAQARTKGEIERQRTDRTKSGEFIGAYAINPANQEQVPIWIADYVLASYGTGAIMAVPAHDERDYEFAKAFGLPIREVVSGGNVAEAAYVGPGTLLDSGRFTGMPNDVGETAIAQGLEELGIGQRRVNYRLRDWLISRQRYWGPPIPILYCDRCGIVPVPEDQLPVRLPDVEDFMPTGTGSSPLANVDNFVSTTCPTCGGAARRETDVSDNFLDSAWYFLRYPSSDFQDVAFDPAITKKWLPVDMYIGGAEHSVLHLLYSRFIAMALHDMGLVTFEEPYERFRAHGLLIKDGAKMSKSHGNVVSPDEYIAIYGADTLRMYLMFLGPYDQGGDFSDRGIAGMRRFLVRVWDLVLRHQDRFDHGSCPPEARRALHQFVQKVHNDTLALKYNTAIASFMQFTNTLQERATLSVEEIELFVLMLAPYAPFFAEELWERLARPYSVHQQRWPEYDPAQVVTETANVAVQVGGRTRGVVAMPVDASQDAAESIARETPAVARHLEGQVVKRIVYVPGRMINLVLK
jgi:leucyl-tRNA synthetase